MAYRIRFFARAREELDECCQIYGASLTDLIWNWLHSIAAAAEISRQHKFLLDVCELFEEGLETSGSNWKRSWKKFWRETPKDRVAALLVVARKWCPPWQLCYASEWFPLLDVSRFELHNIYAVDHVKKEVVFIKFDGLPGDG